MNHRLFRFFITIVLALAAFGGNSVVNAQVQGPSGVQPLAGGPSEYLLLFSMPQLTPTDVPAGMSPFQAEGSAGRIIQRQFEQIQPRLARYVRSGQISGLALKPERAGVVFQVNDPAVLAELGHLPGVQGVFPSGKSAACSEGAARALQRALQLRTVQPAAEASPLAMTASDPAIRVYHLAGETSGSVLVNTTPDTLVTLRILRNGTVVTSAFDHTYSNGYISFDPGYYGCYTPDLDWELRDGDTVEVTAHGSTVSTVVVPIQPWANPTSNKVGGITLPARQVKIELNAATNNNPCTFAVNTQTVTSTAAGAFEKTFPDFNRMANATISVSDANGNSTFTDAFAFSINTASGYDYFMISWYSLTPVTVTYTRGSTALHTWQWDSLYAGSGYWLDLSSGETTQAGDVIALTSAGGSMSYTVAPLSGVFDAAGDKVTGTTTAGRLVQVSVNPNVASACSQGCATATAGAGGAFSISTPLSLGDQVFLVAYDAEGNSQADEMNSAMYIQADLEFNTTEIYNWPGSTPLTVTLKDHLNVLKETVSNVAPNSYGIYINFLSTTITPGDKIGVTDGTTTLTMTVSSLAPRLNTSTSHLTGSSANGHLRVQYWDFRRSQSDIQSFCLETQVTNGSLNLPVNGAQFGPHDFAHFYLTGADGYYTHSLQNTFSIIINRAMRAVYGYTEVPGSTVAVTVNRGATTLDSWAGASERDGYYGALLTFTGTFQTGDVVSVTTGDGSSANLTIPNLSIQIDAPNQLIYGAAPASQPLSFYVRQQTGYYAIDGKGWVGTSNSSGQYSVSTVGRMLFNCRPVSGGSPCVSAELDYYYPLMEHEIITQTADPAPVGADSFGSDGMYATASLYATPQLHTFDTGTDEDWVKFVVSQANVTAHVKFQIMTVDLGPGMDTMLELYGANGTTLLLENDDYTEENYGSLIRWQPSAAGTYYVRVQPIDDGSTSYCGAFYTLRIQLERDRVFFPYALK